MGRNGKPDVEMAVTIGVGPLGGRVAKEGVELDRPRYAHIIEGGDELVASPYPLVVEIVAVEGLQDLGLQSPGRLEDGAPGHARLPGSRRGSGRSDL